MKSFSVAACCLLAACSDGETNAVVTDASTVDAGVSEAGCDGRGGPLEGLEVSAEADAGTRLTLSFVEAEPAVPIVGNNSWLFRLEADGEPLEGAASGITVTPFMPDHGHGTPTAVGVAEERPGTYRFEPVHTRMSGYWEIRVDLESDAAAAKFSFGVCVD